MASWRAAIGKAFEGVSTRPEAPQPARPIAKSAGTSRIGFIRPQDSTTEIVPHRAAGLRWDLQRMASRRAPGRHTVFGDPGRGTDPPSQAHDVRCGELDPIVPLAV